MDFNTALAKHAEWKLKFRTAISKNDSMDAITIAKDNCCDLGKWLHGEAKIKFSKLGSYTDCLSTHASFHKEAGKVANTINAKKFKEAEAMLGAGTPYSAASNKVGSAILNLKKEIGA